MIAVGSGPANLFVFHLPSYIGDEGLYQMFASFGPLESVKVITDRVTGESKGYLTCFVYACGTCACVCLVVCGCVCVCLVCVCVCVCVCMFGLFALPLFLHG